jgi:glycosyltransferase involved in cell wall biosynthesis
MKQLNIFLNIVKALPNFQFSVIGGFAPDMDEKWCGHLKNRMHAIRNLRYLGSQRFEDVMRLLARSKVLANTSASEGFPNTMLEAWSVGVPVVSLQVDPARVIRRERLGLVSGTVSRMVHDVRKLVLTRSLNDEMGRNGLQYVYKSHSLETVCRALDHIVPGIADEMDVQREPLCQ